MKDLTITAVEALPVSVPLRQAVTQGLGSVTKRDTVIVKVTWPPSKTAGTSRPTLDGQPAAHRRLLGVLHAERRGHGDPADGPGLGVEVDEDYLRAHPLTAGPAWY